jgi:hypothetical protein
LTKSKEAGSIPFTAWRTKRKLTMSGMAWWPIRKEKANKWESVPGRPKRRAPGYLPICFPQK